MLYVVTSHPGLMKDQFSSILSKVENKLLLKQLNVKDIDDVTFVKTKFREDINIDFDFDNDLIMEDGHNLRDVKLICKTTKLQRKPKAIHYVSFHSQNEIELYIHGVLCSRKNPDYYLGSLFM